jgi:hypothetical protein
VRILTKPHVVPNEQFTIYFSSTLWTCHQGVALLQNTMYALYSNKYM